MGAATFEWCISRNISRNTHTEQSRIYSYIANAWMDTEDVASQLQIIRLANHVSDQVSMLFVFLIEIWLSSQWSLHYGNYDNQFHLYPPHTNQRIQILVSVQLGWFSNKYPFWIPINARPLYFS